jgi:uncharacterized protein (TIGR00369 family)
VSDETLESPLGATFPDTIGLDMDVSEVAEGVVRGTVEVRPHLLQPMGIVHGGVYASIAETLASAATWLRVNQDGMGAMGQSNNTAFLRPVSEGTIHAEARARHQGRTSWIWDVDMTNDAGKLAASSRVTIAVRPFENRP